MESCPHYFQGAVIDLASRFIPNQTRKAVEILLTGSSVSLMEEQEEEEVKSRMRPFPTSTKAFTEQTSLECLASRSSHVLGLTHTIGPSVLFVHPGKNARRRDPRKYPYTCIPCPEFRKGSCPKGDSCEYAHGVFESWLRPGQYRTRLCKDKTGCARRVCFFAHRKDELRPVNASSGSAMVSPQSPMSSPMSDNGVPLSPRNVGLWQNTPPPLQLNGSRLKSSLSARDMDMVMQLQSPSRHSQMNHYPSTPVRL
ncbi:hypothetical protein YC2023_049504 [Brassica napus]